MNLIERYIYAVTRYLPEDNREDVALELRTNITEMLPDDYTDDDVRLVLAELGSPGDLAGRYDLSKRYLIGPAYFDTYMAVLKLVVTIVIAVSLGVTLLSWLLRAPVNWYEAPHIGTLVQDILSAVITGGLQGAFWVTIVFVILERSGVDAAEMPFTGENWTPDDLPEMPEDSTVISRADSVFAIVFSLLFASLLYFRPDLIGVHFRAADGAVQSYPLLNLDQLGIYMPFILILTLGQLVFFVWGFITKHWTKGLAVYNVLLNLASIVLALVMLADAALVSREFLTEITARWSLSAASVSTWTERIKLAIGVIVIISGLYDAGQGVYRAAKHRRRTAGV